MNVNDDALFRELSRYFSTRDTGGQMTLASCELPVGSRDLHRLWAVAGQHDRLLKERLG